MARWAHKLLSALVLGAICLALFMPQGYAFAQDGTGSGSKSSDSTLTRIVNGITNLPTILVEFVLIHVVLPVTGVLLTVVGVIFDFSLTYSLESRNFTTGASGDMISFGWTLVRDVCNMVFIFALIYASMQVVFGQGDAKKSITNIIIAALLVNFSLFFTKVMIDASNIFSVTFKSAIDTVITNPSNGIASISDFVRFRLGTDAMLIKPSANIAISALFLGGLLIRILVILLITYSLFQVAMIFLGRIVTIIFLMVFSPLGFVGMFIPQLKKFSDDWWKNLNDVVMVTPVFLFTFFIILKLISSNAFIKSSTPIKDSPFTVEQFFSIFIVVFLLQKAVSNAKSMAGEFGNMALKAGNAAAGLVLGAAAGGTALAGRAVIGRGATALAGRYGETLKNVASKGGVAGKFAQVGRSTLKLGSTGSFDIRSAPGADKVSGTLGALGIQNISLGKAEGKGGYSKMTEEREKKQKEYAADLGAPKAIEEITRLKKTKNDYNERVTNRTKDLEEEKKKLQGKKDDAEKALAKHKEELEQATERRENARTPEEFAAAEKQVTKAQEKITMTTTQSTAFSNDIQNMVARIAQEQAQAQTEVAKEMGISLDELVRDIEKTQTKIDAGITRQEQYATSLENTALGSMQKAAASIPIPGVRGAATGLTDLFTVAVGGMSLDQRNSLAKDIRRMRQVKKDDAKKKMKDLLEEVGGGDEDGGGKKGK